MSHQEKTHFFTLLLKKKAFKRDHIWCLLNPFLKKVIPRRCLHPFTCRYDRVLLPVSILQRPSSSAVTFSRACEWQKCHIWGNRGQIRSNCTERKVLLHQNLHDEIRIWQPSWGENIRFNPRNVETCSQGLQPARIHSRGVWTHVHKGLLHHQQQVCIGMIHTLRKDLIPVITTHQNSLLETRPRRSWKKKWPALWMMHDIWTVLSSNQDLHRSEDVQVWRSIDSYLSSSMVMMMIHGAFPQKPSRKKPREKHHSRSHICMLCPVNSDKKPRSCSITFILAGRGHIVEKCGNSC